jgi:hypothetical protein
MADNNGQIFPVNSLREDPNLRSDYPLVKFAVDIPATILVTGVGFAVDEIDSPILLADVIGVEFVNNESIPGEIFGAKATAGTTSPKLKLTICSSLSTSTQTIGGTAFILGRIAPTNV